MLINSATRWALASRYRQQLSCRCSAVPSHSWHQTKLCQRLWIGRFGRTWKSDRRNLRRTCRLLPCSLCPAHTADFHLIHVSSADLAMRWIAATFCYTIQAERYGQLLFAMERELCCLGQTNKRENVFCIQPNELDYCGRTIERRGRSPASNMQIRARRQVFQSWVDTRRPNVFVIFI